MAATGMQRVLSVVCVISVLCAIVAYTTTDTGHQKSADRRRNEATSSLQSSSATKDTGSSSQGKEGYNTVQRHMNNNLVEHLGFLPYGNPGCQKLFQESPSLQFEYPQPYKDMSSKLSGVLQRTLTEKNLQGTEGHTGDLEEQRAVYWKLASMPFVKTVCETGFNAGHSALVWLSAQPTTKLYSFDLGGYSYIKPMADFVKEKFGDRIDIVFGNSTQTIPKFQKDKPEVTCDLIIIDGGHSTSVATEDFNNFRKMANKVNIVVFDDYPSPSKKDVPKLGAMWETKKRVGEVAELFRCSYEFYRGFSIGTYLK